MSPGPRVPSRALPTAGLSLWASHPPRRVSGPPPGGDRPRPPRAWAARSRPPPLPGPALRADAAAGARGGARGRGRGAAGRARRLTYLRRRLLRPLRARPPCCCSARLQPRRAAPAGGQRAAGPDAGRGERGGGSRPLSPAPPQENNKLLQHGRRSAAAAAAAAVHDGKRAAGRRLGGPPLGGRRAPAPPLRGRGRVRQADGRAATLPAPQTQTLDVETERPRPYFGPGLCPSQALFSSRRRALRPRLSRGQRERVGRARRAGADSSFCVWTVRRGAGAGVPAARADEGRERAPGQRRHRAWPGDRGLRMRTARVCGRAGGRGGAGARSPVRAVHLSLLP